MFCPPLSKFSAWMVPGNGPWRSAVWRLTDTGDHDRAGGCSGFAVFVGRGHGHGVSPGGRERMAWVGSRRRAIVAEVPGYM